MLENLAGALRAEFAGGNDVRVEPCVDTRAVPEVFFAVTAGLGLLGRNSLLRTARHGSRVFIGVLFTDLALPEVRHMVDVPPACTTCGGCIRNCPTGALGADGLVQLGRCRSYLSMEYKGEFSPEQTGLLGDCLFGCDGCTAQCPPDTPPGSQIAVDLEQLLAAPDAAIAEWIHGSALEYIGPARLKRNAAACMRGVTRPR
jgi:epoxyqueuosine reductase